MQKKSQSNLPAILILFSVIFIGAMIVMFLGFNTVDANHLGVKIKFGKILGIQEPSIQWTGIWTHVEEYDMRTRKLVVDMQGSQSAVDKTGQAIFGTINVNYRIKSDKETVVELYQNIGTDIVISDRLNIDAIVREGFKQATSKYEALEILEKRQEVKETAIENIKRNFPAQYFEIQDVVITNIDFSEEFKSAIESKKVAEQTALREQHQLEVVKFQQQQEIEKFKAENERLKLQGKELNALLIQQQWIAKWSGNLPQYIITTPDQATFLMQ